MLCLSIHNNRYLAEPLNDIFEIGCKNIDKVTPVTLKSN